MRARRQMLQRGAGVIGALGLASLFMVSAEAQLAITEVMSSAADDPAIQIRNSDYWELTNFGTNRIDLTGYSFNDGDHEFDDRVGLVPFGSPVSFIEPSQSIVFVRNDVSTNEAHFRNWWGSCVRSDTVVLFYFEPGFSRYGDLLTLYSSSGEVVDSVRFGRARGGASFVYDTASGKFGVHSVAGLDGACLAERTGDVGSPGSNAGAVPLRILSQPRSIEVYPQLNTTLRVTATGLPQPRYQWFFEGVPLPGETRASLTLSNVAPSMAGAYHAEVSNGITNVISTEAVVTLKSAPTAPQIISAPLDATVLENKSARFNLVVASLPLAKYQWFLNGVLLPGEAGRSLLIPNCTLDMSGAEVRVRAENPLGAVEARARLYVTTKLDLRITEVHAEPNPGCPDHNDWFELTNFGTNTLQLLGYRFSDRERLEDALVITEPIVLEPGESMIFVNNSAVGSFLEWWGIDNLPAGLKIYSYSGFAIKRGGETLYLWSESAETVFETVDQQGFAALTTGTSKWFDKDTAPFGSNSIVGEHGAFAAVECGDIGSPGYFGNSPPRFVSLERDLSGARLRWRVNSQARYRVTYTSSLTQSWSTLGFVTPANSFVEIIDPGSTNADTRFYQIHSVLP